jgi:NADPH:quinone reductase-like Zn-dependent oxidoreductase
MTTTKALVNIRPGHAEVQDIPVPALEPGYIRVKPTAWAINPDDAYHLGLEGDESCVGAVVGTDYAGVVVEVGPGVKRDFKVGDRIAGGVSGQYIKPLRYWYMASIDTFLGIFCGSMMVLLRT